MLDILLQLNVIVFILKLSLSLFLVSPSNNGFLLQVLWLEVISELGDLSIEGLNNLILALEHVLELYLFVVCLVDFIGPLLNLQLHFLVLLRKRLLLEFNSVNLRLEVPIPILHLLQVLLIVQKLLILVNLERVSLPPQFIELLHRVLVLPSSLIQISSELFDDVSVPPIIRLHSQGLILHHELLYLSPGPILEVLHVLFRLVPVALKLGAHDV